MTVERSLATVMFTDIVGSTQRAAELGDEGWRSLLDRHHDVVRRWLKRFGGREIKTAGDGFLVVFDSPARALACADAIRNAVREMGLEIRCGLHIGEIEKRDGDVGGLAVHIGSRVAALAGPGEVLVSSTIYDAEVGSGFGFEERGRHELKGVPGEWRIYSLVRVPEEARAALLEGIPRKGTTPGFLPRVKSSRPIQALIAFALLLGLAGLYVVIKDRGRSFSPPEAVAESAAPGIAVLPFTIQGAGLDVWREGMVDMLSTNLDGAGGLRSIDSRTVLARWNEQVPVGGRADLAESLEVGRQTGARYVLLGSVVSVGPELRLSAEVYDVEDGEKLGQGQVIGAPDSVFGLVDRLSIEVLRAILRGEEEELPGVNLARVTTTSLPALKAYLEGEVLFRRGDFDAAIPAYERAVEADSTFALANYRLSTSYGWAENIMSELSAGAIERAVRHADRLPEREAVLLRADLAMTQGTLDGIEPLERAVRRYPDDAEAWYALGETYWHLGDQALIPLQKSEEAFARAVQLDPRFLPAYIHRLDYAVTTADSARAIAILDSVNRFVGADRGRPNQGRVIYDLAFGNAQAQEQAWALVEERFSDNAVSMALQDYRHPRFREIEERLYELMIRVNPGHPGARHNLALNRFNRGRIAEALDALDDPALPPAARSGLLYRARRQGLPVPDERIERAAAMEVPADLNAFQRAIYLFFAGAHAADGGREADRAAARGALRDLAARLKVEGDSTNARFADGAGRALDGLLAWQRGDRDQALSFLEEARVEATGHGAKYAVNETIRWWLGELLVEMERPHDAERYFASLWYYPLAERRLGDLYLQMGEPQKAREAYENFLLAWRDADPEVQHLVTQTRQAVDALAPLRRE